MYTHWHAGHGLQNQGIAEQMPSPERRAAPHGPYDRDNPSSRTWRHAPTTVTALGRMDWQYAIARPDRRRPETHGHTTLCVPRDGSTRKQEHGRQNLKNATENTWMIVGTTWSEPNHGHFWCAIHWARISMVHGDRECDPHGRFPDELPTSCVIKKTHVASIPSSPIKRCLFAPLLRTQPTRLRECTLAYVPWNLAHNRGPGSPYSAQKATTRRNRLQE